MPNACIKISKYILRVKPSCLLGATIRHLFGPEHLSLKVPNIEFDFDVSVDSVQWQTVTLKSSLRHYNSLQMSILCKTWMYCIPKIT